MTAQNRRLRKADVTIGMRVTCRRTVATFGTIVNGLPPMFRPGDVGTVGTVDVPCVTYAYRRHGGTATYVCVDFVEHGRTWRCALYYNNIRIIHDQTKQTENQ